MAETGESRIAAARAALARIDALEVYGRVAALRGLLV